MRFALHCGRIVRALYLMKCDIVLADLISFANQRGATALYAAADAGKESVVFSLLEAGADCNTADHSGK